MIGCVRPQVKPETPTTTRRGRMTYDCGLRDRPGRRKEITMQVQDIMIRDAKFCSEETNLAAATEIMWLNGCGALPVVDGGEGLLGRVAGAVQQADVAFDIEGLGRALSSAEG